MAAVKFTRLSRDGLMLQTLLGQDTKISIIEAAQKLFSAKTSTGSEITSTALTRATRAAKNLATIGRAKLEPTWDNPQTIISVQKQPGMQLEALMNLAVRQSVGRRSEDIGETPDVAEPPVRCRRMFARRKV